MTVYEVESIGVVSLAKILAVMGLLWGLLMAILSILVWGMGAGMTGWGMGTGGMMGTGMLGYGAGLLVWLVVAPLYGALVGAVTALVYNAAASLIGGIDLELA